MAKAAKKTVKKTVKKTAAKKTLTISTDNKKQLSLCVCRLHLFILFWISLYVSI
jgi:hypothetical protein